MGVAATICGCQKNLSQTCKKTKQTSPTISRTRFLATEPNVRESSVIFTVNFEAPHTVVAEIERRGIEHIVCLGDIVGMGLTPM